MKKMDEKSIYGMVCNIFFFVASLKEIETSSKIFLMIVSAIAGITTIIYNLKKIKKL